jgi:hypothetical protein
MGTMVEAAAWSLVAFEDLNRLLTLYFGTSLILEMRERYGSSLSFSSEVKGHGTYSLESFRSLRDRRAEDC